MVTSQKFSKTLIVLLVLGMLCALFATFVATAKPAHAAALASCSGNGCNGQDPALVF